MADSGTPQSLVNALKQRGELRDPALEAAFLAVPRHHFLPNVPLNEVYSDEAIPTKRDNEGRVISSSSQPTMMVIMLEQLGLRPGDNVLEIGTGTGYNAAIMQHLVDETGRVTTIEYDPQIAAQAKDHLQRAFMGQIMVVQGDGASGFAPRASYDRIIATVGIWDVPRTWVQQLKPKGVLVAPLWLDAYQISTAFTAQPDGTLYSADNRPCGFVSLRGPAAGPSTQVRVGNTTLYLSSSAPLDGAAVSALLSQDAENNYLGVSLTPSDYWNGFIPYLMLNYPSDFTFINYFVVDEQKPYGIEGSGVALVQNGSACFASMHGGGVLRCFAGADAYLTMTELVQAWDTAGRPTVNHLRLRLWPKTLPKPTEGTIYPRRDHYLQAWME